MPTPTEIIDQRMTYCHVQEDHCLCAKCAWDKGCSHSCDLCKRITEMTETEKDAIKMPEMLRDPKPIQKCSMHCRDQEELFKVIKKLDEDTKSLRENADSN
jgi:hypothetical protein